MSETSNETTRSKLLLLALPLVFLPVGMASMRDAPWWMWTAWAVPALAMAGAVMFFFPEQTVEPVQRRRQYKQNLARGFLGTDEFTRLLRRRLRRDPDERFVLSLHHCYARCVSKSLPPQSTDDRLRERLREYGRPVVTWLRSGNDPVLLRDALAARATPAEMQGHLDGSNPLDPDLVAALAALAAGTERDTTSTP